jgi:cell division protein FtsB
MNTTAILLIILLLALVWFGTNTLMAFTLIGGKKDELKNKFSGEDKTLTELHRRVEELKNNNNEPPSSM